MRYAFIAFVYFSLLISCSPSAEAVQTAIAETETARPTSTSTFTPSSTHTPSATPTPNFYQHISQDVIEIFLANGLEVDGTRPMTKDDYGLAPLVAVQGTRFLIPSLCSDCGGRIMSFYSQEDLFLLKEYYEELGRSSAIFFSWVFVESNLLLQINGDLSEARAREYEAALYSISNGATVVPVLTEPTEASEVPIQANTETPTGDETLPLELIYETFQTSTEFQFDSFSREIQNEQMLITETVSDVEAYGRVYLSGAWGDSSEFSEYCVVVRNVPDSVAIDIDVASQVSLEVKIARVAEGYSTNHYCSFTLILDFIGIQEN